MADIEKAVSTAKNEVGYLEKRSNAQLDSKTANAGSANYTKYGKWYGLNPDLWCAMFICWVFHEAYGRDTALKLLCGKFSVACEQIRQNFISKGQYHTSGPRRGDLIFFKGTRHAGANHIGLVTAVSGGRVHTVEGNTSGGSTVIDNGGGVAAKSYTVSYSRILGYGRPAYDAVSGSSVPSGSADSQLSQDAKKPSGGTQASEKNPAGTKNPASAKNPAAAGSVYTKKQFIKDIQKSTGAKVDGIAGPETLSKARTLSCNTNSRHASVKYLQKYLNAAGYSCGAADCIFGPKTKQAVMGYQKKKGLAVDGIVGKNTWKSLFGLA